MKKYFREYAVSLSLIAVIFLILIGTGLIFWNKKMIAEDLEVKIQADLVKSELRYCYDEVTRHVDVTLRGFAIIKDKKFIYLGNKQIRIMMENNFRRLDSLLEVQKYTDPEGIAAISTYKDSIRSFVNYHEAMIDLLKADSLDKFKRIFKADKGSHIWTVLGRAMKKVYAFEDDLTAKAQARYDAAMKGNIYIQILLVLVSIPTIIVILTKFRADKKNHLPENASGFEESKIEEIYNPKVIDYEIYDKGNILVDKEIDLLLLEDHVSKRDKKLLDELNLYLEENSSNPEINVEDISKAVGVSRVQLYRKVKTLTGYSVNNYMQNLRMEKAKRLLIENELSVSEIAYIVGFSSPNYFSTVFKNKFQVVPSEYREMLKSEVLK